MGVCVAVRNICSLGRLSSKPLSTYASPCVIGTLNVVRISTHKKPSLASRRTKYFARNSGGQASTSWLKLCIASRSFSSMPLDTARVWQWVTSVIYLKPLGISRITASICASVDQSTGVSLVVTKTSIERQFQCSGLANLFACGLSFL